ncbi:MAG TPA: sodium:proton antiporter [Porphyromonadaceae bacterium]|nr:sodium:proton antiporter [Porphyromonadaceae bacterium]
MTDLTFAIVVAFVAGYACIALESVIKVNKAAIALLMFVTCWTLLALDPGQFGLSGGVTEAIERYLGSTATTLFFLMGAMTIVEIVDQNGGFNFVRSVLRTTSKRKLLWRIALMTFLLSAILDNLTTSIVMIMVLRKLVSQPRDRMVYASLVVIAANSGGAFSPIGDVTTIMLWNSSLITSAGVIAHLLLPSLVSLLVPALLLSMALRGHLDAASAAPEAAAAGEREFTIRQQHAIFWMGVGGLVFVPVFRALTGLPPFVGILLVLGLLWLTTELFYSHLPRRSGKSAMQKRVSTLLSRIDMTTILFFLGILMAVSCLEQVGVLESLGQWLDGASGGNHYVVTGAIGIISSIVDNVPLVAGCMGMYPLAPFGDMAVDGIFWQLLAYCAGVGGSMLIIGSAAGVVVMGLEKITFGWYMRHITPVALAGYLAGMACYWLQGLFM